MKPLKLNNIPNDDNTNLFLNHYKQKILSESALNNVLIDSENITDTNNKIIKNNMKETISVIIPTYNRKKDLKYCIDTILRQTIKNIEILVVDDGSTDNTEEMIKNEYNDTIKYFRNKKNSGPGFSRKFGYQKATGDYIIFCDDDDYYIDNTFFEKAINIMKKNKEIAIVCANAYIKYEAEKKYEYKSLNIKKEINNHDYLLDFQHKLKKPYSTFTTIFKKDNLIETNFDEMDMVNDSSIYLRALISNKKTYILEDIIGIYRIHSQNITFNIKSNFLIENLIEKLKIKNYIQQNIQKIDSEEWWENQILLTMNYYILGSKPKKEEYKKVMNWVSENTTKNRFKILLKLYYTRLKSIIGRRI